MPALAARSGDDSVGVFNGKCDWRMADSLTQSMARCVWAMRFVVSHRLGEFECLSLGHANSV